MDQDVENQDGWEKRDRLLERLDRMVESGRLTDAEARRLRAPARPNDFNDAVRDIRVRHAGTKLDVAVAEGSLTRVEADSFVERLGNGEHPRSLRAHLRKLRQPRPS